MTKDHHNGFFATYGATESQIIILFKNGRTVISSAVVAKDVPEHASAALLELAKLVCHMLNAGVAPGLIADLLKKIGSFASDKSITTADGVYPKGLSVVQPMVVKYLYGTSNGDVEILPGFKTKRLTSNEEK
jgi:hypothetical protein